MGEARISSAAQLFRFCELDFPFPLGPADGRYLRRGPDGADLAVVTIRALHASRRSRTRGRRPAPVEAGESAPEAVAITRATVIAAKAFDDAGAADRWLKDALRAAAEEAEEAIALVNSVVAAHRVAAHDPHVRDVVVTDAQRVRLGYGTGDGILSGDWHECYVVPPQRARRPSRRRMLSPQEEMAGILTGRRPAVRPSEELLLRARLDFDHGRSVEAALVARATTEALAAEGDAEELSGAGRLAASALEGGLSEAEISELAALLQALERKARRRRYAEET